MTLSLLLLLLLATQADTGRRVAEGSISRAIYSAASTARGSGLCDKDLRERLTRNFDRKYGKRVANLIQEYRSRHGEDPGYVILPTCRLVPNESKQIRVARKALAEFEPFLRALELHVQAGGKVEPNDPDWSR